MKCIDVFSEVLEYDEVVVKKKMIVDIMIEKFF